MKILSRAVSVIAAVIIVLVVPFAIYPITSEEEKKPIKTDEYKAILSLWNVDCFEGGKGSRADFLNDVLSDRKSDGVIVIVKNHTEESMQAAIKKGEVPDMISYGVGVGDVLKYARELRTVGFKGGEFGGKSYAVPWCVGGYYLIAKNTDKRLIDGLMLDSDDKIHLNCTVIASQGDNILPLAAMRFKNLTAENVEQYPPKDAYAKFISKSGSLLLGTQRDLRRLEQRGEIFFALPLEAFSDIVQYVSVTTTKDERYKYCEKIVEYLISESVQGKLNAIGMMRADGKFNDGTDFYGYDFSKNVYTVSPFLKSDVIFELQEHIKSLPINDKIPESFKNSLKYLK